MQLRVARFCLDCEELHTDNSCPRCASESYVFLSSWLKVDERRRWKRSASTVTEGEDGPGIAETLSRWVKGEPAAGSPDHPLTRAADHVVHLKGDEPEKKPSPKRRAAGSLGKVRT